MIQRCGDGLHTRTVHLIAELRQPVLGVLAWQRLPEAQFRLGHLVQQTVGAPIVRPRVDLALLVLPESLEVGGRGREPGTPGGVAESLARCFQGEAMSLPRLAQLFGTPA
jgi:hypothetical protein